MYDPNDLDAVLISMHMKMIIFRLHGWSKIEATKTGDIFSHLVVDRLGFNAGQGQNILLYEGLNQSG